MRELEFYADQNGREPVREWLDELDEVKRAAALRGLSVILAAEGPGVSSTEYGKPLNKGRFEFRDLGERRGSFRADLCDRSTDAEKFGGKFSL